MSVGGLIAVVALCGLMIGACGSSSPSSKASVTPTPTPTLKQISNVDACMLVTAADATTAAGVTVSNPSAGAAVPGACIYISADGSTTVFVIAQAYADASSANSVSPEQLAAALNGAYGIANAKPVSGIGDKAVEYTVTSSASNSTGAVIFVFKSNVVMMISISRLSDTKQLDSLARKAVATLHYPGQATVGFPSLSPTRPYSHRRGAGAHQFHRPSSAISDGTRSALTIVAPPSPPAAIPMPSSLMKMIWDVANAPMATQNKSAAAVMIRPVRWSPVATASLFGTPASWASLIRVSRKTP